MHNFNLDYSHIGFIGNILNFLKAFLGRLRASWDQSVDAETEKSKIHGVSSSRFHRVYGPILQLVERTLKAQLSWMRNCRKMHAPCRTAPGIPEPQPHDRASPWAGWKLMCDSSDSSCKIQGLGLMSLFGDGFHITETNICWNYIPTSWVMWNIGTFTPEIASEILVHKSRAISSSWSCFFHSGSIVWGPLRRICALILPGRMIGRRFSSSLTINAST